MRNVAPNVWQIGGLLPFSINAYLVEDVLIDCGTRFDVRLFLRSLEDRALSAVALTHVHPDHQGAAKALRERFKAPLACHSADREEMEGRRPMGPDTRAIRFSSRIFSGPPCPVDRVLKDGDRVGSLRVIHAPGHTPGHCMFYREEDGLLICGDVVANMSFVTLRPGLHQPPAFFSHDPALNRASMRRALELNPRTVLFGHGPPLRDLSMLRAFVDGIERRA